METAQKQQSEPRRRTYGRPFVPGTSANPHGRALTRMRAEELFGIMAPDYGHLTATDTVLLRQACFLLSRSERVKDTDAAIRMSGEARRLLQSLQRTAGKRREAERPTLREYLESRALSSFVDEPSGATAGEFGDAPAGQVAHPSEKRPGGTSALRRAASNQPTDDTDDGGTRA